MASKQYQNSLYLPTALLARRDAMTEDESGEVEGWLVRLEELSG